MLITEGACGKITPWKSFHHFPYTMLRKRWMTTLLANLKSSIDFSRNSSVKFTKYIVRYIGRPLLYAQPYSKNSHLIRKINPQKKSARKIMQRWDFRISLSFGHDPLKCNCGEFMSFVDIYYPCDPAHGPPFMVK